MSEDVIVWTPSKSGGFTTRSAYEAMRLKRRSVKWAGLVWRKHVVPKYGFNAWQKLWRSDKGLEWRRKDGLYGVEAGLQGCLLVQATRVEVESDSMRAIMAINDIEKPPWYCVNLVTGIRQMASRICFNHVYREANRCADYLASLSSCNEPCQFFIPPLGSRLDNFVEEDKQDILY
ncbi:hypothetical protein IFM89_038877 [Coptis chinensis]|uniref:RNase H type-1 domain-containing protein n=1 Tax=Coptis chinensis TaxID=261450 RepID=A0A835M0Y0_9MAGN|nr:hypothetical protein IFM89_038877 [Coptis chinensis]